MIGIYLLYSTNVHNDSHLFYSIVHNDSHLFIYFIQLYTMIGLSSAWLFLHKRGMLSEIAKRQKERRLRTMLDTNLLK